MSSENTHAVRGLNLRSDARARNKTMIRMHATDMGAVNLDGQEEAAKSELVEANKEIAHRSEILNKTRETLQVRRMRSDFCSIPHR